ncbi:MAG: 5-formyltetrahydrofolate cyclo-ligase [Xanthomonadales bacterium]|nr:5-formyltetrahydrofolate cyclo-ligase [Xanthomonadales bacterium]
MKLEPSQKTLKAQLRKGMREKRAALDEHQRHSHDAAINRLLLEYAEQTTPAVIAAFRAFDGEPDIEPALKLLERRGATLALPVLSSAPGKLAITMRHWYSGGEMAANRFGIEEPVNSAEIRLVDIDLVLVPLVAWDESGGRLGMGASFYDRLFQPFEHMARPVRLGVAYQLQKTERVPTEPWDIRLHGVLTEQGRTNCADRA